MRRRGPVMVVIAVVLGLAGAPSAGATQVTLETGGTAYLYVEDHQGVTDDLRLSLTADRSELEVAGTTATADGGCRTAAPGVVRCRLLGETIAGGEVTLGAGNDHLVLDESLSGAGISVAAGPGDDTLEGGGPLSGDAGNDTLRVTWATPTEDGLFGGDGDDQLVGGPGPGTLLGGNGNDHLQGGPGNDVVIDAGDARDRDTLDCGGGQNLVQGDSRDTVTCATRSRIDLLGLVNHHWSVFGRYTRPDRLDIDPVPVIGGFRNSLLVASDVLCQGRGCHGASFVQRRPARGGERYVLHGGVRIPGRRGRAVTTGAKIAVRVEVHVGGDANGVTLTKDLVFTARKGALPRKRKRCSVTTDFAPSGTTIPCGT